MADYAAPSAYPYVDAPTTGHALLSADYNQVIAALVDLGGSAGRVKSLETDGVRAVIVSTGSEARPTAAVVLWVSPNGTTPTNATATDVVVKPAAPLAPAGLAASSITTTGFTLNWTASVGVVATISNYDVEIGGTIVATPSSTTYAATGLTAGTNYTVRVRARDLVGNVSGWAAITNGVTTTAGATQLFADTFNRADGAVGNSWAFAGGGGGTISSNAVTWTGGGGYAIWSYRTGQPRVASTRAVFTAAIGVYQGIVVTHSSTTNTGIRLFNDGGTWKLGDSGTYGLHDVNVAFTNTPSSPYLSLRVDFDGTTITAYINGTLVHTTTPATMGLTLDTNSASVYRCGYVGEPGHTAMDSFEVWTA